jgi:GH25 family lysozyme M1 (1,4-beta-N-acetylmuramidase)
MTVFGVDVSHHQDPTRCDWPTAFAAGLRFVWVKGSEGMEDDKPYVDPAARVHIEAIRRTPLLVGMFHMARPDRRFATNPDGRENGIDEGLFAASTATALGVAWSNSMPVAIDLEYYTPGTLHITDEQRDEFVLGLVDTLESRLGRLPVVYAGSTFWRYQHTPALAEHLRARGVLLWQPNYTTRPDPTESIGGWPWSFWQHSGGRAAELAPPFPGLPTVDQNVYRGTEAELRGLAA